MTDPHRVFASFLRGAGLRPVDAASALGVSAQTVANWLSGRSAPDAVARLQIEAWSRRLVPASVWVTAEDRARLRAQNALDKAACKRAAVAMQLDRETAQEDAS